MWLVTENSFQLYQSRYSTIYIFSIYSYSNHITLTKTILAPAPGARCVYSTTCGRLALFSTFVAAEFLYQKPKGGLWFCRARGRPTTNGHRPFSVQIKGIK